MKAIIKGRYAIFIIWVVTTILLAAFQPDINAILRYRGQTPLSDDSSSVVADSILSKMEPTKGNSDILVFYDKDKLSDEEMNQINDGIKAIAEVSEDLGINNIIDPFNMPDAKSSLISEDGTTLMVSFKLDKGDQEVDDIQKEITSKLKNVDAEYYLSGEDFISNDYLKKAVGGVEKSAVLTVLFILIILMIMFRSVVTPLVSLIAVAFSYLCSMGIAAQLIDKANFPITSLTQILLVLILFGIGTDYNILLFNRFKEELSHGCTVDEAIIHTYRTAGKTIAFSILTVFIAFLSLVFSKSPIYQSGVVVVIGVVILLLEILTLTPFIMKTLGNKLFWPSKQTEGHGDNKFWGFTSTWATKHPIITVIAVLVIIAPTVLFYQQKLNSNTVKELGDSTASSKGFNIISEHFGQGQAMPSTVVIESKETMDNQEALAVMDNLTERIKSIKGVSKVSSVTQPQGEQLDNFYVSGLMSTVTSGITQTQDGVNQINDGLTLAANSLGSADFSQVTKLIDGTAELETGMSALTDGLQQIQAGIADGSGNSETIENGITTIQENLSKMSSGVATLAESYTQMQAGFTEMGNNYQSIAQALLGVKNAMAQMQSVVTALGSSYSGAQSDVNYLTLKGTIDQLVTSLNGITPEGIQLLNSSYQTATAGFATANQNLAAMSSGLSQMADGLTQLEYGLQKAAGGIGTVVTNMDKITSGLGQMKSGQQELVNGLSGLSSFGSKLSEVNDGLQQISDGLGQTNDFLSQLNNYKTFFIPEEAFGSAEFTTLLDNFMNKDRTITKMTVILEDDPYSPEALKTIDRIRNTVSTTLDGTVLTDAKIGVAGPSAVADDMDNILNSDLSRMRVIVIIGILLILILIIRSVWEPVVITASLLGSYYAAMFVENFVFLNIRGLDGIQSFVPFFAFIIIVALGVDYSIFLMMRFKEYPHMNHREAIVLASKHIGGVVMSAVIILGGTFATLIPSGFSILIQLAVAVIAGLIVLCFIMLPVFLPAMISLPAAISKHIPKDKSE